MKHGALRRLRSAGMAVVAVAIAGSATLTAGVQSAHAADFKKKGIELRDNPAANEKTEWTSKPFNSSTGKLRIRANFETSGFEPDANYRVYIEHMKPNGSFEVVRYTAKWSANGAGTTGKYDEESFDREIVKNDPAKLNGVYRVRITNLGSWSGGNPKIKGWIEVKNVKDPSTSDT